MDNNQLQNEEAKLNEFQQTNNEVNAGKKSSNVLVVILIILLVVIIVIGAFFFINKNKNNDNTNNTAENETQTTNEEQEEELTDIEKLEAKIAERETKLFESVTQKEKDAAVLAKTVSFQLMWYSILWNGTHNEKLLFNQENTIDENFFFDQYFAIIMDSLTISNTNLTDEEKTIATNFANESGIADLEYSVVGKISEDDLINAYNKYFKKDNYIHRDALFVPANIYYIYNDASKEYFVYQNADGGIGGISMPKEVTSIDKTNEGLTVIVNTYDSLDSYSTMSFDFILEDGAYKLVSYSVVD